MTTIVTRASKGSALTYAEMDANFTNLNNAKLESVTATQVSNTPAGSISAITVQAAINELDSEKEPADATILKTANIGVTVQAFDTDISTVAASQVEMETGTEPALRSMSPLRVGQAISAQRPFASAAENIAGTVENKIVDPLGIREAFNASGSAPVFACRAWVNFNGTGTVAIRASGNVSSITDNGVGDYTVNFSTAMPDVNYAIHTCYSLAIGNVSTGYENLSRTKSTTQAHVCFFASATYDPPTVSVSIFR